MTKSEVAYTKKAHEVQNGEFLIIVDRPCRVHNIRFLTPNGLICISGTDTQMPLPDRYQNGKILTMVGYHEMLVGPFDDVLVPKPNGMRVNVYRNGDFIQLETRGTHPCKPIDMSVRRAGQGNQFYLVGLDIFTGVKRECLYLREALIPQITVSIEEADLLDISDDGYYSVMNKDNSVTDGFKIYREDLAKTMKQTWADGERTIVVKVAETMGMKGIIEA